jgi:hypothetical protein
MVPVLVLVTSPFAGKCLSHPGNGPGVNDGAGANDSNASTASARRRNNTGIVHGAGTAKDAQSNVTAPAPVMVPKLLTVPLLENRNPMPVPATEAPERIL